MTVSRRRPIVAALASLTLLAAAACGSDEDSSSDTASPAATEAPDTASTDDASEPAAAEQPAQADDAERPTIVVTTNILGDVVGEVVGDEADVITIMPVGADPHDFQASAQQVNEMVNADVLIVNGAGFEEGLLDVIENAEAEGVPTYEAISAVDTIEFGEGGHDHDEHGDEKHSDDEHDDHSDEEHDDHSDEEHEEHSDDEHEEHSDDEHSDDHGHDHSGADPHFFTDPMRMAAAVDGMVAFLTTQIPALDAAAIEASAAAYNAELEAIDEASVAKFDTIPEGGKVLVTNHESLGYFADHYGFEIAGVVIPGGSTTDAASAGELAELAEVIEEEGVPAIFADTSSSDELAQVLADEVGGVEVIDLFTESLGEPGSGGETYLLMLSANAERVTAGLT